MAALAAPRLANAAGAPRLVVGGTGSALAAMRKVGEAWRPGLVRTPPSLGSAGGLRALQAGVLDIALSARPLEPAEREQGLSAVHYATTPLAIATHARRPPENLTFEDLARILAGETTTWPDGTPLRLILRPDTEADWHLLGSLDPVVRRAVTLSMRRPGLTRALTDQENASLLEELAGSLGTITLGQVRGEERRVNLVSLNGLTPGSASWPMQRSLHLAFRSDATGAAREFLDHLESAEGRAAMAALAFAAPAA